MKREYATLSMVICILGGFVSGWFIPSLFSNVQGTSLLDIIQSRGYMIVGTSSDWPPFEFFNLTGTEEYEGFDIDLCNIIANSLGVTVQWSDMEFGALIAACDSGLIDMIAAAMFITPDRAEVLAHSVPYIRTNEVVIALANSTININSIANLSDYTVGVQTGTAEMWELEDHIPPIPYVDYPSATVLIQNLVDQVIELSFVDEPVFTFWSNTYNLKSLYTVPAEPCGLWIRQNEPEFLHAINDVILEIFKNGSLDALVDKWFT